MRTEEKDSTLLGMRLSRHKLKEQESKPSSLLSPNLSLSFLLVPFCSLTAEWESKLRDKGLSLVPASLEIRMVPYREFTGCSVWVWLAEAGRVGPGGLSPLFCNLPSPTIRHLG